MLSLVSLESSAFFFTRCILQSRALHKILLKQLSVNKTLHCLHMLKYFSLHMDKNLKNVHLKIFFVADDHMNKKSKKLVLLPFRAILEHPVQKYFFSLIRKILLLFHKKIFGTIWSKKNHIYYLYPLLSSSTELRSLRMMRSSSSSAAVSTRSSICFTRNM